MKVYGSDLCPDCIAWKARGIEAEYIEITSGMPQLKEFLRLRDTSPVFAPVKEKGAVGIPCFVFEDGYITLDPEEAAARCKAAKREG